MSVFQIDPTRQNNKRQGANQQANQAKGKAQTNNNGKGNTTKLIDVVVDEDTIPDSLLHPRWKIQRTTPVTYDDLNQSAMDLDRPEGLKYDVTYNDTINRYIIATRMGSTYLAAPIMMTPEEYMKWSEKHERDAYFRSKNSEIFQAKGKEKFDFSDMHFDLDRLRRSWPWRCAHQDARNRRTEVWRYAEEDRQPIVACARPQQDDDGLRREDQLQPQR